MRSPRGNAPVAVFAAFSAIASRRRVAAFPRAPSIVAARLPGGAVFGVTMT
jgi:hypothetical protein